MRYLIVLMLISFPVFAEDGCGDADLESTWRIYTSPLDMGEICTTSCQLRIGEGNVAVEPSNCFVRIGETETRYPMDAGSLIYSSDRGLPKLNAERYAVVDGSWSFQVNDSQLTWEFDGEQEHDWGKRDNVSPKGAVGCKKQTIHGRAIVYRDGVFAGQVSATMVWRSSASNPP